MKLETIKDTRIQKILSYALSILPRGTRDEIIRIIRGRRDCPSALSEIRIRPKGISSLVISGENVRLSRRISEKECSDIFKKITEGSLYAFERELGDGYVTAKHGIRIGIALSEIKSEARAALAIVIRLPLGKCSYVDSLYDLWQRSEGGMLLYSPPGEGKTAALAALAKKISDTDGKRVVIVDERGEFAPEDFDCTCVDIIRGYPKPKGIEIAFRTLGAELIITDEIGNAEEARMIELSGRGGVPFIASAHAKSIDELYSSKTISPLISLGFFKTVVRLYRRGSKFGFEAESKAGDVQ